MNASDNQVLPGIYRHYKGGLYQVFLVAKHSETLEELVVYRPVSSEQDPVPPSFWVRPKSMFVEQVENAGKLVPRFTFLHPASSDPLSLSLNTKDS